LVFVLSLKADVLYLVCCGINKTLIMYSRVQPTKDYQH